jgi:serine/threonine protein kinase
VRNRRQNRRFENEVEAVKALKHPNVIKLIDHSALDAATNNTKKNYLVMPLATGGDLSAKERLQWCTNSIDNCLLIASQITAALSAAHALGIIHRDVKPKNVLFEGIGPDLWLSDFGICLVRERDRFTEIGEVVGPRSFMAPELEGGGQLNVTPAADVYSLGKVIYYMYSGGVVIPREDIFKDQYQGILRGGQRSQLLGQLLDRMICLIDDRILDIASVDQEIQKIVDWEKRAKVLSLQPETLTRVHNLRQRVRSNHTIKAKNEAAREQEEDRVSLVSSQMQKWIVEELIKIAALIESPELKSGAQQFSLVDESYLKVGVNLDMRYDYDVELQLNVRNIGSQYEHQLNFLICEEDSDPFPWNPLARSLHAGEYIAPRDLRIAIVPTYAFSRAGEPSTKARPITHFPVKRSMIGETKAPVMSRGRTIARSKIVKLSDTTTDFNTLWNQHLILRASEWPSSAEAVSNLISEAVETLIENVEEEMLPPDDEDAPF